MQCDTTVPLSDRSALAAHAKYSISTLLTEGAIPNMLLPPQVHVVQLYQRDTGPKVFDS